MNDKELIGKLELMRNKYINQAKFADVDYAANFREFAQKLDELIKEYRGAM